MTFEAFFLPSATKGQRFCVLYPPDSQAGLNGAVVHVHAFAEEMNKSRRMVAQQAKALAAAGYAVLQIDLYGCGDSAGDFGDATWDAWVEDVVLACDWLRQRYSADVWLWGLRAGCLLAAAATHRLEYVNRLLLWQPVNSGKQYLQQFLRLKLAGEILGGAGKGVMDELRASLAHGTSVEIAGYTLSPDLARGLENAEFGFPDKTMRVEWIELNSRADASLSPAAVARLDAWGRQGHEVHGTVVCGPGFWQTTEIVETPELIDVSLAAMRERHPS